jgi:hypothetical protein
MGIERGGGLIDEEEGGHGHHFSSDGDAFHFLGWEGGREGGREG